VSVATKSRQRPEKKKKTGACKRLMPNAGYKYYAANSLLVYHPHVCLHPPKLPSRNSIGGQKRNLAYKGTRNGDESQEKMIRTGI
jgi:hypothetical protein